jgi:hypothetical protein
VSGSPSRVIPVVKGTEKPYLMGATRSGTPIWTDSRTKALGWSSETEATTWIDGEWPELRAALARAGTPMTFEAVALEVKPLGPIAPRVPTGAKAKGRRRTLNVFTASGPPEPTPEQVAEALEPDCACPELCLVHPPLGLATGGAR